MQDSGRKQKPLRSPSLPPFSLVREVLVALGWAVVLVALLAVCNFLRPEYQPDLWEPRFIALVAGIGAVGALLGTLAKRLASGVASWICRFCRLRRA